MKLQFVVCPLFLLNVCIHGAAQNFQPKGSSPKITATQTSGKSADTTSSSSKTLNRGEEKHSMKAANDSSIGLKNSFPLKAHKLQSPVSPFPNGRITLNAFE